MIHRLPWTFALLAVMVGTAACASGSASSGPVNDPAPQPDPQSQADAGQASDASEASEMEALYWARLDSTRARFTEADAEFMAMMIEHHSQAVVMAEMAPDRADSESIRILASRILSAQEDEIAIMERWLRDRNLPVPEVRMDPHGAGHGAGHGSDPGHGDDSGHADDSAHPDPMPGLLSAEQMAELEAASGPEFDRLFLTSMIEHHRGAITMVRTLFATEGAGQDPAVFKFASDIQVDQTTEVARMERMLAEFSARDGSPSH